MTQQHPLTVQLVELIYSDPRPLYRLAKASGIHVDTFATWRKNINPNVLMVEAILEVLGYELALERIDGQTT